MRACRPVLADTDEIEPDPIGELGFLDDVADRLGLRERPAVGAGRDVAERVEAELERALAQDALSAAFCLTSASSVSKARR